MSYEDFRRVFQSSEDDLESRGIGGMEGSSNFVAIPPKPIPELSELLNQVTKIYLDLKLYIYLFTIVTLFYCFYFILVSILYLLI